MLVDMETACQVSSRGDDHIQYYPRRGRSVLIHMGWEVSSLRTFYLELYHTKGSLFYTSFMDLVVPNNVKMCDASISTILYIYYKTLDIIMISLDFLIKMV